MADDDTTPEMGETEPEKPDSDDSDEVEKLRAALKKANKEAEQSRLKLKEIEDRDKTEAQRLADTNRDLEERAAKAEAKVLRLEVCQERGLPMSMVNRLHGTTKEELEADAEDLLEAFKSGTDSQPPGPTGRPKERLRPGAVPEAEPEETDPSKLAALVPRSRF